MRADWRARLDAELEASQGYKAEQRRLARRPLGRHQGGARLTTIRAAARPACAIETLKEIGEKITAVPAGLPRSTAPSSASSTTAARRSRPARASTGRPPRRSPSARCCSRATRCGSPARTASAAPSRSAIRCWSIRRTRTATSRSITWARQQARFEVINSMLSEEAVLGFEYGYSLAEPNALDAVGGAVRRLRQRRAGGVRPVHLLGRAQVAAHVGPRAACCRTATKGRGRSTPRRGSSASCRCAPRTTCRSPTAPRRPTTSTSCAGS